jgi:hypothetical protein
VRHRLATIAFFALLAPGALAAQASPPPPDMSLLAAAGVVFPERLGGFDRVEVRGNGPGQVAATYIAPSQIAGDPVVTILISRAVISAAVELAQTEASIGGDGRRVTAVRDLPAPRGAPGAVGRLWRLDETRGAALIGAVIWHRDGWRIKIRGVVSAASGDVGWAEVQRLIDTFDWGGARATEGESARPAAG